jgi:hypothetical protein
MASAQPGTSESDGEFSDDKHFGEDFGSRTASLTVSQK